MMNAGLRADAILLAVRKGSGLSHNDAVFLIQYLAFFSGCREFEDEVRAQEVIE